MFLNNLIRWSGVTVILAGILLPLDWILGSLSEIPRSNPSIALGFSGAILLIFGLMGMYGCQIRESGVIGFLGFVLTVISVCIQMGQTWLPESGQMVGVAGVLGPLIGITGFPGYILLGIGSWRGGKLPRWAAVVWPAGYSLSFISMLIFIAGFAIFDYLVTLGMVIWAVGLIGAGVAMLSVKVEPDVNPMTEG